MISNSVHNLNEYGLYLLAKMFEYEPSKRISAKQAMTKCMIVSQTLFCLLLIYSADVKKQTVFFLQTADVWSTSSAAEGCRCGPQTADVLTSKKQTAPKCGSLVPVAWSPQFLEMNKVVKGTRLNHYNVVAFCPYSCPRGRVSAKLDAYLEAKLSYNPSSVATFSFWMILMELFLSSSMKTVSSSPSAYHAPPVTSSEGLNSAEMTRRSDSGRLAPGFGFGSGVFRFCKMLDMMSEEFEMNLRSGKKNLIAYGSYSDIKLEAERDSIDNNGYDKTEKKKT
ncbi:hypothetical protein LXL04_026036 [Taraxacum kok-saghyz]